MTRFVLHYWHKWAGEYRDVLLDSEAACLEEARKLEFAMTGAYYEIWEAEICSQRTVAGEELTGGSYFEEATEAGHGNG